MVGGGIGGYFFGTALVTFFQEGIMAKGYSGAGTGVVDKLASWGGEVAQGG
jgi:hypothetical protein